MSKRRVEKKMKKIEKKMKRKKQALAECEFKVKIKEQEAKREMEKQTRRYHNALHAAYWARVWKSDGFDGEGLENSPPFMWRVMRPFKCETPNDCPLIVDLYARIGLHRYNMLQGSNLQLHHIEKYNMEGYSLSSASYYITLIAEDPATHSFIPFQTSSHENRKHELRVGFYIARPQDTGTKGTLWHDRTAPQFYNIRLPKWQSDIDIKHFYLMEESELKENDWIHLYLELGFVTTNRQITSPKLSDLKIVEVMVDTEENVQLPNERLKGFKDATFYIKYDQVLGEGKVCKRRAIIRRIVDLRTERMFLAGHYCLESETDSEHNIKALQHITNTEDGPVKEAQTKSSSVQQQMDFSPIKPVLQHQRSIEDRTAHQIQLNNRFDTVTCS
ncbi:hypothetical protein AALP_AA6G209700 [Arabis alpina]|uniref:Uncharacterized protein n=1 Tax=Arabis alpina TaxID=50452 RepID=A0A087GQP2_ARAAL|nr:hypothetical protein AALP_AA6G209700 [Arabis alpina]